MSSFISPLEYKDTFMCCINLNNMHSVRVCNVCMTLACIIDGIINYKVCFLKAE